MGILWKPKTTFYPPLYFYALPTLLSIAVMAVCTNRIFLLDAIHIISHRYQMWYIVVTHVASRVSLNSRVIISHMGQGRDSESRRLWLLWRARWGIVYHYHWLLMFSDDAILFTEVRGDVMGDLIPNLSVGISCVDPVSSCPVSNVVIPSLSVSQG